LPENNAKPSYFSKTVVPVGTVADAAGPGSGHARRSVMGRPAKALPGGKQVQKDLAFRAVPEEREVALEGLIQEWVRDLRVMGRSPRTIGWYEQKMASFLKETGLELLEELGAPELKGYLAALQERGLADNTVHGAFQTIKAFANWAAREEYPVDAALLRQRGPKVAQKEMEVYSAAQLNAIFAAMPAGWPLVAVQVLLGTGMRVSELVALDVEDFEDDREQSFLKVRRGKGGKFRRVPISQLLRRELDRYVRRIRPDGTSTKLLLLGDGRPVSLYAVESLFRRAHKRLGFALRAHRFRHTFSTEYLRNGGDMERLRRILGHTTYQMVLRYVHLDRGDLSYGFEERSPF
jgi:integrase/recombinase XerD